MSLLENPSVLSFRAECKIEDYPLIPSFLCHAFVQFVIFEVGVVIITALSGYESRFDALPSVVPPRWSSRPCTIWNPVATLWGGSSPSVCWWGSSFFCCWLCSCGRWASSAEGTKRSLKLRKTGKRMKMVGTGSRKTSDPPCQSCDALMSPSPACGPWSLYLSYLEERNLLQIFRRPHWCCSLPHPVKPGADLRWPPLQPGHMTGATTTPLRKMNLELWKGKLQSKAIFMDATLRGQPSGENCYLKVFFINVSLLYWSCLYICINVLLFLLNSSIIHSSTEILEIHVPAYKF